QSNMVQPEMGINPQMGQPNMVQPEMGMNPQMGQPNMVQPEMGMNPQMGQPNMVQPEMGMNPQMGQPNMVQPEMGINPQMGQPNMVQPEMGMNPQMGQPNMVQPEMGINPQMTPQNMGMQGNIPGMGNMPNTSGSLDAPKPKKKKLIWISFGIAFVALIAVAVFFVSKIFFTNESKEIKNAMNKTFSSNNANYMEIFNEIDKLDLKESTTTVSLSSDIFSMDMNIASNEKKAQLNGTVQYEGVEADYLLELSPEKCVLASEALLPKMITYYVDGENNGYITEEFTEEQLKSFNDMIKSLFETSKESKEVNNALVDAVKEEFENLEFEKVDEKKFEIGDKEIGCKGYKTVVTGENILNIYDAYVDSMVSYMETLGIEEEAISVEDLKDSIDKEDTADLYFYLYEGSVVSMEFTDEKESIELRFLGKDSRMDHIEVWANGEKLVAIKNDKTGKTDNVVFTVQGLNVLEFVYDGETGAFSISSPVSSEIPSITGTIEVGNDSVKFALDETYIPDLGDVAISVGVSKGANFKEASGEELNIGTASEEEIQAYVEEVQMKLLESYGGYDSYGDYDYDDYNYDDEEDYSFDDEDYSLDTEDYDFNFDDEDYSLDSEDYDFNFDEEDYNLDEEAEDEELSF
ncbi:MAG: hypothetical protein II992_03485, partial [Lachnospiraceae bacterium]|nr:hypothetical protein [Lachnospiraceae bacterium]